MVNGEELAICTRRGHDATGLGIGEGWIQCKWCGMWLRAIHTIEEREDAPAAQDMGMFARIKAGVRSADQRDPAPGDSPN